MTDHIENDLLIDYLHGELEPSEDARVFAHLGACAVCREAFDLETQVTTWIRTEAERDERDLPPAIRARVLAAVRPTAAVGFARFLRPVYALPVAAALAIAAWLAVPHAFATRPTIDAAYYLHAHDALQTRAIFALNSGTADFATSTPASPAETSMRSQPGPGEFAASF